MRQQQATGLHTGHDFGLCRESMGVTPHYLAKLLGVAPHTLTRWESSLRAVPTDQAKRWRCALRICAETRAAALEGQGYQVADVMTRGPALMQALLVETEGM